MGVERTDQFFTSILGSGGWKRNHFFNFGYLSQSDNGKTSMTTPRPTGIRTLHSLAMGTTLLASVLIGNLTWAQTASDAPASAASSAVKKTERVMSDSWITTKVKSEILANSMSKAFKVGVKTKQGMVSLDGKLPSQDAIDLVKMIAEKVKGVKSVDVSGLSIG